MFIDIIAINGNTIGSLPVTEKKPSFSYSEAIGFNTDMLVSAKMEDYFQLNAIALLKEHGLEVDINAKGLFCYCSTDRQVICTTARLWEKFPSAYVLQVRDAAYVGAKNILERLDRLNVGYSVYKILENKSIAVTILGSPKNNAISRKVTL